MTEPATVAASFRDPSGFVFERDGVLLRQINRPYAQDYEALLGSGLHAELVARGLLVPNEPVDLALAASSEGIAVIKPERVPTISYPYEWSFSQLKDAALLTLDVMSSALSKGMILKDASAFNVQFLDGRPIFIDTLSFERTVEGEPWVAYKQFCQHFLAPLALMALVDVRLGLLLRSHIDGIPLDLASKLLPGTSKLNTGLAAHIHFHAKALRSGPERSQHGPSMSRTAVLALLDSLQKTVNGLKWSPEGTVWADYYENTNYTPEAMDHKKRMVCQFLDRITPVPRTCWDLGANDGQFSALASGRGISSVAWDFDPAAVEIAYLRLKKSPDKCLLPLVQDLTNPSPGLGWASEERESLVKRGPVDVVLALALVHHLAIGNNVPLKHVSKFFSSLARWAIVEFVPKDDSQVMRMLSGRKDVFNEYSLEDFERALEGEFKLVEKEQIPGTVRTLILLESRSR